MLQKLRNTIFGEALSNDKLVGEKFTVFWGLPILSSDAISSVAYACEAILIILIPIVGAKSYIYMLYAALCIVLLLFILVFSYSQTIDSYPNGGGSYIVAKDNLGIIPGLTAGASLSIDYVLTVAVSVSAGTAAITSAIPQLLPFKMIIAVVIIILMTVGNLRGMKDSARLFGIPTYLFIISMAVMIITGIVKVFILKIQPQAYNPTFKFAVGNMGIILFLRAFSSGCTALTGVEAVSNGIPNFQEPAQKHAKRVLFLLACIILFLFGGTAFLATLYHAVPVQNGEVTALSQIATMVFGSNTIMYFVLQFTTAIILVIAANTSYADLPLLLSLISRDGYAPKQFSKRGKRLSFSNGIILLAIAAITLVIIFGANEINLLPLYALGVFLSFTLSQFGMFVKWVRDKNTGWRHKALINGMGSVVTCFTFFIIAATKFELGGWAIVIAIPTLVYLMLRIKAHYVRVHEEYRLNLAEKPKEAVCGDDSQHVVILIEYLNKPFLKCLNYARHVSKNIVAFHVSTDPEATEKLIQRWEEYNIDVPLIIKESPYRDLAEPLLTYIESEEHESKPGDMVTVIIAQAIINKWWENILHKQTSLFLKSMLYKRRNIIVTTIPYLVKG